MRSPGAGKPEWAENLLEVVPSLKVQNPTYKCNELTVNHSSVSPESTSKVKDFKGKSSCQPNTTVL